MTDAKRMEWTLRIAVAGEFVGHGSLALQGKSDWVGWVGQMLGTAPAMSTQILFLIGLLDLTVALVVLLKPMRAVTLWAAFWGFWTALVRPLVGQPFLDFVERSANWGAPLALFFLMGGWPKRGSDWWK